MDTIEPGELMSQAIIHNGLVYLSGQVALSEPDANIMAQTSEVLARIDALLEKSGSNKSLLISATIWLSDLGDFEAMNRVWSDWLGENNPPVRATVGAKLALPGLKVEIQVTAATRNV